MNHPALILPLVAMAALAEMRPYAIHALQESRMELLVTKTGLLKGKQHRFVFERYSGTLQYDPQNPQASQVNLSIDSRSAVCKDTWVSAKDLRKIQDFALKDMLDAERYPNITFASSAIKQAASGRFEVQGTLTIRGLAKPVAASVSLITGAGATLSFEGNAEVRLTGYGLKPPSAALGTIGTKDEMAFSFFLISRPAI